MNRKKKIVLAVSGASGSIYAMHLINELNRIKEYNPEYLDASVVFTSNAPEVWKHELGGFHPELLPFQVFRNDDFYAPFASGSSDYSSMVICPCSVGMMGRIANGCGTDLISRAADVMLKEKRKLVLVVRESPLNLIHIQNMQTLCLAGAVILPASPSFYSLPKNIDEAVLTVVHRIMQIIEIPPKDIYRWGENT